MKWFRFEQDGKVGIGVEQQGTTYDVTGQVYTDSLLEVISREFDVDLDLDIAPLLKGDVRQLAPYVPARNVICVGKNYADHIKEMDTAGAGKFVLFTKAPTSIVGPFEP
ncbi:MAG TPA: hydrolase, partial [Exiguobacterium sp.]|nr:hydrolase [Exiguobacterium sp.]